MSTPPGSADRPASAASVAPRESVLDGADAATLRRLFHLTPTFLSISALSDGRLLGLPGRDGYEVARRARQRDETRDVFLVALTGYGQAEDRRRALDAGFDRHLNKPVDPAALREVMQGAPAGPRR